jgi:trehalose/maltose hydrolase-like predicted phosphorylase
VVDRLACYIRTPAHPSLGEALARLDAASDAGFDGLLREQRAAWARRWETVDIRIPADPKAQRALRFVLFQLWGLTAGAGHDELVVGARGATGPGYRGHVFWDADVFVLPALASIDPAASRAMVRYRIARLPAARRHARRSGFPGARYPWESAASGEDVTPTIVPSAATR